MNDRLKVYRDPECKVPVESFSFGKLEKGKPYQIPFYLRNDGFVRVEEIVFDTATSNVNVKAKILSDHKVAHLLPREIHKGLLEVYTSETVKGKHATVDLLIDGIVCFLM